MKKLLRLIVMMCIRNTDEYYQKGAKSAGMDIEKMSHDQISLWKATNKLIEADILIETAFSKEKTTISEIKKFWK